MRMRRWLRLVAVVIAMSGFLFAQWRLNQTVNVVVVNASGQPIEFSWQPHPFGQLVSVTRNGCETSSMDLRAGETWRVTNAAGEIIAGSASVSVPLFAPRVAVEVWLYRDGMIRTVPVHETSGPVGAPYPPCGNAEGRAGLPEATIAR
jgi:hypothetical protein